MKKIELIPVGNQKFPNLQKEEDRYLKKINHFVSFSIRPVKEISVRDEKQKREKEGAAIRSAVDKKDLIIGLDESGKMMDSREFARLIQDKLTYHPGKIVFLIGGFAGLSKKLDEVIDMKLSFSKMTMAHDLFRVVFLEQLYRALTIVNRIPYHR